MEKPGAEFFAESNIDGVNELIAAQALTYSSAIATVEKFYVQNDPARKAAMLKELEETNDDFKGIMGFVGDSFGRQLVAEMLADVKPIDDNEKEISDDEYIEAIAKRDGSAMDLVDLTGYLQEHGHDRITELGLSPSDERALELSWRSVWSRIVGTVKPLGGVVLADVADMFDGMVRFKYAATYDPMHRFRGDQAQADVAARTFYEVFAPHLSRAIIRSGRDKWAGH